MAESTMFGCIVTRYSDVFIMSTVVTSPATVVAVANECLRAQTRKVIKPYSTNAGTVLVWLLPANAAAASTFTQHFQLFRQQKLSHVAHMKSWSVFCRWEGFVENRVLSVERKRTGVMDGNSGNNGRDQPT